MCRGIKKVMLLMHLHYGLLEIFFMQRSWLDKLLIVFFVFAAFMACIYAPLFYFQCGWEGLGLGNAGSCNETWVGRAWLGYLKIEPYYGRAPLWLRLVNEFDSLLFSWFYLLSIFVFWTGRQDRPWYRAVATFVAGMMAYAMLFYLTWESLTFHETHADLARVFSYNSMWLVIFFVLLIRLYWLKPVMTKVPSDTERLHHAIK